MKELTTGKVVAYQGTKKSNPDRIPNGTIGTVVKTSDSMLKPYVLVQWSGSMKGVTCWVPVEEVK